MNKKQIDKTMKECCKKQIDKAKSEEELVGILVYLKATFIKGFMDKLE